jgi:hypothetical protein
MRRCHGLHVDTRVKVMGLQRINVFQHSFMHNMKYQKQATQNRKNITRKKRCMLCSLALFMKQNFMFHKNGSLYRK